MRCIAWLVVAACSGAGASSPRPPHGSSAPVVAPPPSAGPSERECDELIAHVVELRLAELRQTLPPERLPTEPELAQLRDELRAEPGCRNLSRASYRCGLAAATTAEYAACHETPSSSTSNSSVAPGGITPAAPRSP